ncbi:MAG: hypothetical protein ACI97A_000061 [Planctomycetota bacterium]|jgi:hypothetical protein
MTNRLTTALSISACLFLFLNTPSQQQRDSDLAKFARFLDANHDNQVGGYEAAGRLLLLAKEAGGADQKMSVEEFLKISKELMADGEQHLDLLTEMTNEVDGLFKVLDKDGDKKIELKELGKERRAELDDLDVNRDGVIERHEVLMRLKSEFTPVAFVVNEDRAIMSGTIDGSTPGAVLRLRLEHPQIRIIEMHNVPGSADDHSNLLAADLVRKHGYDIHLADGGEIASGGVDFFCAGTRRTVGQNTRIGVHSWAEGEDGREGADLPNDHPEHAMFLEFYKAMGIPEAFYWFTLKAAPADGIHWMSPKEISHFGLTQERVKSELEDRSYGLDDLKIEGKQNAIAALTPSVHPIIRKTFDRYTRIVAPNGKPIHILAQEGWTNEGIVRTRKILGHFLTNVPGSKFGANKEAVANAMADRRATLALFRTEEDMELAFDGPLGELDLGIQDLRANECPIEGSADYMGHVTRDAAFEEILHLVHDYGIRPALPGYDQELQQANLEAAKKGVWQPWPEDEPDSHRNEYIAAAYDNYIDLWQVKPKKYEGEDLDANDLPTGTSHFGHFRANSRMALRKADARGFKLVEGFLPDHLTYEPTLPQSFEGVFSIRYDTKIPYTSVSKHLRHVRLCGALDSTLWGNQHANRLSGNAGNNSFEGHGGDDIIDGGKGIDVAIYRGKKSDYQITVVFRVITILDKTANRDGKDVLTNVEFLQFSDGSRMSIN